jgi:hypothetical protein
MKKRYVKEVHGSRYYPGETYEVQRVEVRCCNEWIRCNRFTVTCHECGADYNQSGDKLAPREQWGEETGEHWSECY